jgi:hypothetical protein
MKQTKIQKQIESIVTNDGGYFKEDHNLLSNSQYDAPISLQIRLGEMQLQSVKDKLNTYEMSEVFESMGILAYLQSDSDSISARLKDMGKLISHLLTHQLQNSISTEDLVESFSKPRNCEIINWRRAYRKANEGAHIPNMKKQEKYIINQDLSKLDLNRTILTSLPGNPPFHFKML